ncbi:MAG: NifU family protein [Tetrasphaera sp.]
MIPTHPEAVPGEPQTLSWVIPDGALSLDGPVQGAPGRFGELLADGSVTAIARPGRLLLTLAAGRSWRADGAAIRTALHAALEDPAGWTSAPVDDAAIEQAVAAVIAGPAGEMIARHGGQVRVAGVQAGRVDLEVGGACAGCPAAGLSVGTTLAAALRAAVPGITEVVVTEVARPRFVSLGRLLPGGAGAPSAETDGSRAQPGSSSPPGRGPSPR